MIERHYKDTLLRLMQLPKKTPRFVVYFFAGSMPGVALLHSGQLSLFGMITRQADGILHNHDLNLFRSETMCKASWFNHICNLCLIYSLPHPLDQLQSPLPKVKFKSLIKEKMYEKNFLTMPEFLPLVLTLFSRRKFLLCACPSIRISASLLLIAQLFPQLSHWSNHMDLPFSQLCLENSGTWVFLIHCERLYK